MTKEKYMALADFQTLWTNSLKPYIVGGFIAMLASTHANAKNLVLADGSNIAQATFIAATEKGANSGVATLDATGKVPSSQLPSFVDDVIEVANFAALPETGEGGKIYVTLDDNKTYRWGGTTYVEISAGLALGETQGTAYEGSKGKANADAIAALQTDKANKSEMAIEAVSGDDTKKNITLKSGLSQDVLVVHQDISGKVDKETGKGLSTNDYTDSEKTKLGGIAAGAQVNVIETIKVNGTALTPDDNKAVDVTFEIPERVTAEELAAFVV